VRRLELVDGIRRQVGDDELAACHGQQVEGLLEHRAALLSRAVEDGRP